eukprot:IDg20795t1
MLCKAEPFEGFIRNVFLSTSVTAQGTQYRGTAYDTEEMNTITFFEFAGAGHESKRNDCRMRNVASGTGRRQGTKLGTVKLDEALCGVVRNLQRKQGASSAANIVPTGDGQHRLAVLKIRRSHAEEANRWQAQWCIGRAAAAAGQCGSAGWALLHA